MSNDTELSYFKERINLVEYAQAQGYEIDRKESSRASIVMRCGADKIIVATSRNGAGIYFSVRDSSDHGTIIDFVQHRQGLSLAEVRRTLRAWAGGALPSPADQPSVPSHSRHVEHPKPEPRSPDRAKVLADWSNMQPAPRHPYLERVRRLHVATLADARFADRIRIDARGNAVFAHYDAQGLCGFEKKNRQFTGFSPGGEKGLWYTANLRSAGRVVIVESAIDALSHAQLKRDGDAAYISVGGTMSEKQQHLLRDVVEKTLARGARIILATDRDLAGDKLAEQIKGLAPSDARIERHKPAMGKDWNEQLQIVREAREVRSPAMRGYEIPASRQLQR